MAIEDEILSGITASQGNLKNNGYKSQYTAKNLSELNPEQKEAVLHSKNPLLIIAGAGSGKTRVITTKIAYLVAEEIYKPWEILAVTFTKKAATEMLERAYQLQPVEDTRKVMIRTFHSFGARFLRVYGEYAGINPNFTVYDEDDMVSLLQKAEPKLTKKEATSYIRKISLAKDYCLTPDSENLLNFEQFTELPDFADVYRLYEERLHNTGNVDFGSLITLPVQILKNNAEIRMEIHRHFRCIMVDEYQDTNIAQFELLKALCDFDEKEKKRTYLCLRRW